MFYSLFFGYLGFTYRKANTNVNVIRQAFSTEEKKITTVNENNNKKVKK